MTSEEEAIFERGLDAGESSQLADWVFALDGVVPDDVDIAPSSVAAYVRALRDEISTLRIAAKS